MDIRKVHLIKGEKDKNISAKKSIGRMTLHVSNDCNLRWKYCYANGGNYNLSKELMSYKTVLDMETERNILESIFPFIKSRTSIIISHRLPSITFVDEIIAVKNGKILERGKHESLINKQKYYYSLWTQQNLN
jgi:hypothetical protein